MNAFNSGCLKFLTSLPPFGWLDSNLHKEKFQPEAMFTINLCPVPFSMFKIIQSTTWLGYDKQQQMQQINAAMIKIIQCPN